MPIVVLLVGGAIAFWGMTRETARMRSVEAQVQSIVRFVGEGRDLSGTLDPANPAAERLLIEQLKKAIGSPQTADIIRVRVTPGDTDRAGQAVRGGTHTAMLMIGDQEILGLRIHCDDPNKPITVLGYWTP